MLREEMAAAGLDPEALDVREISTDADAEREELRRARRRSASTAATCSRPCARARRADAAASTGSRRADLAAAGPRRGAADSAGRDRGGGRLMARATATKVGELAPALELPDTHGNVHSPAGGRARRRPPWWSGPATTAPTRSAGTTGSSRRRATTGPRRALPRRELQRRRALPARLARRDAGAGSRGELAVSRTSTTKARMRRGPGPPRSPRTSTCSTPTCGSATRAPPDADHMDPAPGRRLAARGAGRGAGGRRGPRAPTTEPVGCSIKWKH